MGIVLAGLQCESLLIYLDNGIFLWQLAWGRGGNISIFSVEEIRTKKCSFFLRENAILSVYVFSEKSMYTDPEKSVSVDAWPVARNNNFIFDRWTLGKAPVLAHPSPILLAKSIYLTLMPVMLALAGVISQMQECQERLIALCESHINK